MAFLPQVDTVQAWLMTLDFLVIEIFYVCEKDHELYTQQVYKYRQNISNTNMHIYYVKLTGTYISTLLHSLAVLYINFLLFNLSNRY